MAAAEGFPAGFRFHPTDKELVVHYLKPKNHGLPIEADIIPGVDLYKCHPSDLPGKSFMPSKDRSRWYFFAPRDRKHPNGSRTNRATAKGHWKSTGIDRLVLQHDGGAIIGKMKTLVYHEGRASKGVRTDWVIHEYRLPDESMADKLVSSYALCRLFNKKLIPSASAPPPEVPIAADNDDEVPLVPAPLLEVPFSDDLPWMDYQLNSLDGGSRIGAVADDDTDNGSITYSGIDDELILEDDSWIDYFL